MSTLVTDTHTLLRKLGVSLDTFAGNDIPARTPIDGSTIATLARRIKISPIRARGLVPS